MCGRFTLISDLEALVRRFSLQLPEKSSYFPRYNIAPSQPVLAVISDGKHNRMGFLRWGLVPAWSKEKTPAFKLINARAETLTEKFSFKSLVTKRRCLIPADSFYEWQKKNNEKVPVRILLKENQPFAMAGLWDSWQSPGGEIIHTCTIITTRPNDLVKHVHDRMPAILIPEKEQEWLNPEIKDPELLKSMLTSYPESQMTIYEVSPLVNSPKNDSPACILPIRNLPKS